MKQIFADTFYWIALINPSEEWYEKVFQVSRSLVNSQIVTTEEVLSEFLTFYSKAGFKARQRSSQLVTGIIDDSDILILPQTHQSFLAGFTFYSHRLDKGYSLTDCISMNAMQQMGIQEVLTHDRHFVQEGFIYSFSITLLREIMNTHSNFKHLWHLDPDICYLNHGSFGATPIAILDYQQQLRREIEREPVQFLARELEQKLDHAREKLAKFLGGEPQNLVFVPNATFGVNSVLRSLAFAPGDEILVTDHTYNACRNAVNFVTKEAKAIVKAVSIPFPSHSPQEVIDAILEGLSPRTRLVLLDHITSPTALIWPVEAIATELSSRGIDTLIDGAHAPGSLPVDLKTLDVAYYTGNCHKWLCAPKGAGFLYVRPDKQRQIRPLVISHGANSPRSDRSRFLIEFDWMGTDDPTPYLSIPQAIEWLGGLFPQGWPQLYHRNHQLTLEARNLICHTLGVSPSCPDEMVGSMATIDLGQIALSPQALQTKLWEEFKIEIPVIPWSERTFIRISAQVYNHLEDYQYLAKCLEILNLTKQ